MAVEMRPTSSYRPLHLRSRSDPHFHRSDVPPSFGASLAEGSSLDFTQRLEHKLAQYDASQSVLRRWIIEIISVTTSALCMGAIIASLAVLKERPLDKWPSGLTIVNILSKIASAALILPISEAIGQLKWAWFSGKSRDAIDFEIFDKASRGAWGSLLLLYRTKGRSLAALGALLTLLLLAIDTFFQQATDLPFRWTLNGAGLIPRVIWYEPHYIKEFLNGDEGAQSDYKVLEVADAYFLGNGTQPVPFGNGTRPDIPLTCPTSSCTWPPYQTLGICSKCTDASSLLSHACIDTTVDWTSKLNATTSLYPNATVCGYFLNATSESAVLMSGYIRGQSGQPEGEALLMRTLPLVTNPLRESLWGGSIHFKNFRDPIIDVLISSSWNKSAVHANTPPVLHECVLNWCVKTIESSYLYGTYRENVIEEHVNDTSKESPWSTFTYDDGSTDQTYDQNITYLTVCFLRLPQWPMSPRELCSAGD
ncbi:hypothetical protein FB567DRAFT_162595 [Paraphoma chrysanthemicola]|uniref:DUF3176 domain containing protein n=1 Tax=Paraphoma chrysanthemicola TaxID=798071 RepID=A0A8K0RHQ3_9PLEO|nr:hypothetical protein FB567DRAFT_162595 [Paraphoma chrysanthemicola]